MLSGVAPSRAHIVSAAELTAHVRAYSYFINSECTSVTLVPTQCEPQPTPSHAAD
jgi:hypothetical protein